MDNYGKDRCEKCGREISLSGWAQRSHAAKHEREAAMDRVPEWARRVAYWNDTEALYQLLKLFPRREFQRSMDSQLLWRRKGSNARWKPVEE